MDFSMMARACFVQRYASWRYPEIQSIVVKMAAERTICCDQKAVFINMMKFGAIWPIAVKPLIDIQVFVYITILYLLCIYIYI